MPKKKGKGGRYTPPARLLERDLPDPNLHAAAPRNPLGFDRWYRRMCARPVSIDRRGRVRPLRIPTHV